MLESGDGYDSYLKFLWCSESFRGVVDLRRIKWGAQSLWRSGKRAKKRARRRERREREREAATQEMEVIEQFQMCCEAEDAAERARVEAEAQERAAVEEAVVTIQRQFRRHLADLEQACPSSVPTMLNPCVRLLGGDEPSSNKPSAEPESRSRSRRSRSCSRSAAAAAAAARIWCWRRGGHPAYGRRHRRESGGADTGLGSRRRRHRYLLAGILTRWSTSLPTATRSQQGQPRATSSRRTSCP